MRYAVGRAMRAALRNVRVTETELPPRKLERILACKVEDLRRN